MNLHPRHVAPYRLLRRGRSLAKGDPSSKDMPTASSCDGHWMQRSSVAPRVYTQSGGPLDRPVSGEVADEVAVVVDEWLQRATVMVSDQYVVVSSEVAPPPADGTTASDFGSRETEDDTVDDVVGEAPPAWTAEGRVGGERKAVGFWRIGWGF